MAIHRVVIAHGAYGSPEENWFPWIRSELENLGHLPIVPRFPTPDNQVLSSWLEILDQETREYDDQMIMVGHSLGPALILRKLEQMRTPIRAAFFVAGFLGELGSPKFDSLNSSFFERQFDWSRIRDNCHSFHVYHADNDPYVPLSKARDLADRLEAKFTVVKGAGHFNCASGYVKFELLLRDIEPFLA